MLVFRRFCCSFVSAVSDFARVFNSSHLAPLALSDPPVRAVAADNRVHESGPHEHQTVSGEEEEITKCLLLNGMKRCVVYVYVEKVIDILIINLFK